jgi:pectate lyase
MHLRLGSAAVLLALLFGSLPSMLQASIAPASPPAFPGAQGWAATTPGGRGGQVLRVTTLAADGPGSLTEALRTPGPRIVVLEVAGVIDLKLQDVRITAPYLTIAGQTAPSPGITLIRGGLTIATHDVVVRHLRIRAGTGGLRRQAGVDFDAITTQSGARDVIVDHCSLTWATDENLSASGTRFVGATPDEWRSNVSHRITFSNNLLAEGLRHATHAKGEHSKGSLIHDNSTDILIVGNLYAHNYERSALFKGGTRGQFLNNLIYDPGQRAVHYNLVDEEWAEHLGEKQVGELSLRGNVLRAGPSTEPLAFFMFGGSGDVRVHLDDNLAVDRIGEPLPLVGRYSTSRAAMIPVRAAPALPPGVRLLAAADVQDAVLANAGARPWDRDDVDRRILANVVEGRGAIIDHEREVGGYPVVPEVRAPFIEADWDMATMAPKRPLPRRPPPR